MLQFPAFSTREYIQEDIEVLLEDDIGNICKLIVHNDEVNTFDWVIRSLVEVCLHTWQQAEQCALIIHTKGKYAVKEGNEDVLKPMKDALTERGIGATIEHG